MVDATVHQLGRSDKLDGSKMESKKNDWKGS